MSNYIFHPRIDTYDLYNRPYYQGGLNPYKPQNYRYTINEWYCYGRFWEIADDGLNDYVNTEPTLLGYVRTTDNNTGTESFEYKSIKWWYHAYDFDSGDYSYWNMSQGTYFDQPIGRYGSLALFQNNNYYFGGIVEEIKDISGLNLKISTFEAASNIFRLKDVINGSVQSDTGSTCNIVGFLRNPIYNMYGAENIEEGHYIGWKLPFWMYKRILLKKRGELL